MRTVHKKVNSVKKANHLKTSKKTEIKSLASGKNVDEKKNKLGSCKNSESLRSYKLRSHK
jgi:hypothetical protein